MNPDQTDLIDEEHKEASSYSISSVNNLQSKNSINYILVKKDQEINLMTTRIDDLRVSVNELERENYELKLVVTKNTDNSEIVKYLKEEVEVLEAENKVYYDTQIENERQFNKEKTDLKKKLAEERSAFNDKIEGYQLKIDNIHNEELISSSQKFQIRELEDELKKIKFLHEEENRKIEFKNIMKFSDLKAKMMHSIESAKKNSAELNSEQLDITSKLTLLQNHQMIVELEVQSKQVEELIQAKFRLERKIFDLKKELEIQTNVQLMLADKNKKLINTLKSLSEEIEINKSNTIDKYNNTSETLQSHYSPLKTDNGIINKDVKHIRTKSYFNPKLTANTLNNININTKSSFNPTYTHLQTQNSLDLTTNTKTSMKNHTNYTNLKFLTNEENLIKKIRKLEYDLEKKKIDLENLKASHELFQEKLKQIERKYYNIFTLFDEGLRHLSEEIQMSNSHEIYINIETIKKLDFESLPVEKKFSLLLLLMKKITPLIKIEDLEETNYLRMLDGTTLKVKNQIK